MQLLCFTRLPERLDIQIAITSSRMRKKDNSHHENGDHKWRKFSRKAPKVRILAALRDILTEREYEYVVCFGRVRSHEGSDSFKPYDQKRKLFIYHPQKSSF